MLCLSCKLWRRNELEPLDYKCVYFDFCLDKNKKIIVLDSKACFFAFAAISNVMSFKKGQLKAKIDSLVPSCLQASCATLICSHINKCPKAKKKKSRRAMIVIAN